MKPVPWSEIPGGRERLEDAFNAIEEQATQMQTRFSDALDMVGQPGMAAWDPIAGTVELRGKTFRAQMLGSFDGKSWLWSWANSHLAIPEELTSYARAMRDESARFGPAFATPMIEDDDEQLPHMLGGIAIANGFGEAFYYANQSQIYLLLPGQLEAIEAAGPSPARYATVFSFTRRSLADIVTHLRGDENLAKLDLVEVDADRATLTGAGYSIEIVRKDRLRDVLAEIKTLPFGQEEARGAATVFLVSGLMNRSYDETRYTIAHGGWVPAEHFEGRGGLPWQAIAICERLNKLERLLVHDSLLVTFYPRS